MFGEWVIKPSTGMPQKVATAFAEKFGEIVGASYVPIAYLGEQLVNGKNHAILAEQTLVVNADVCNIVMIIMNEKGGDFSVVSINPILSGTSGKVKDAKEAEFASAKKELASAVSKMLGYSFTW